jgi:3-hydroxy-9,10-secoandrosta-1,3,5(10)-triene-9,17-dione monooxygenase
MACHVLRQCAAASPAPSGLAIPAAEIAEECLVKNKKAALKTDQAITPIAPPEPALTPAEMIARAVALRPLLRAQQNAVEAAGRLSDEMNRRFIDAGFYRVVQPRLFGGYEFDVPTFMRVMMEVARGCSESAWVLALTAGHAHLFAGFPIAGQAEVYGADGEFRAPGVPPPSAEAAPVPGGYRVKGGWDYVSGCDLATHFIGGCLVKDPSPQGSILIVIDRADYTIIDNWSMFGMQGTGSKRIEVKEMFLPASRAMPFTTEKGELINRRPGWEIVTNPMYSGRTTPFLVAESTAVVVGAAYGALDCYADILQTRKSRFPPFPFNAEMAEYQHNFGRCQALIDTAHAAMIQAGEQYMELCRDRAAFDASWERRLQMVEQQAIHLAYEAVDIMFRTAGTSMARKDSMLGRFWRNIGVIRGHLAHQSDSAALNFARAHFGLPTQGRI